VAARRRGTPAGALAGVLATAVALGACTGPARETEDAGPTSVTVAWGQPFTSYNDEVTGSTSADAALRSLTRASFASRDADGELRLDPAFGSAEVLGEDPLRVRYAVADGVTWSDGVPVDAVDLLLDWAAGSGALNSAGVRARPGPDAVFFDGEVGSGLAQASAVPEVSEDRTALTLTFDAPVADWQTALGAALPAHVVAREALGTAAPQAAKDAVLAAVEEGDAAALAPLSRTWTTGFALPAEGVAGEEAAQRFPSTGPFAVREAGPERVVLERVREQGDGEQGNGEQGFDELVLRHVPDARAAVEALAAGEVDVVSPPPTAEVLAALEDLDGVRAAASPGDTAELLLLRTADSRNPGVFADQRVRQAFLRVVPRQEVVDELVAPLEPDAQVRDSHLLGPADPGYEEVVAANGSADYREVDVAGARALLAQAGVSAPEVCVLHDPDNPRRTEELALLQDSAAQAGFRVTDCGTPDWTARLSQPGAWDAVLLSGRSTGDPGDARAVYATGGGANATGYSDPTADGLFAELAGALDDGRRRELVAGLDAALWQGAPGVPLYQSPSLTAWSEQVVGIVPSALPAGVLWNAQEWRPAG